MLFCRASPAPSRMSLQFNWSLQSRHWSKTSKCCHVIEDWVTACVVSWKVKMERWSHEPRNVSSLWMLRRARKCIIPYNPEKELNPCWHPDFRTTDLRNYTIINVHCFKLLSLCYLLQQPQKMNTCFWLVDLVFDAYKRSAYGITRLF